MGFTPQPSSPLRAGEGRGWGNPGTGWGRPERPLGLLALAIVLLAFGLRLWRLAAPSFWWDEAYSALVASEGLRDIVATLAREDYHPPLHYVLLHFWMKAAGQGEFTLRFVSVWFGTLAIAAAWTTARRLISPRAAPIAALLFGLSPFLWYYSQEARMFALVPVLGTLALYFCARGAEESRRRFWLGYVLTVALGLWDFYYAIFTPIACGVWLLLAPKRRHAFREWLAATALAALLYLPWVPIFLGRSAVWSSALPPDNGPAKVVLWSWPQFLFGLPNLALYAAPPLAALLGVGAIATLIALGWILRERARQPEGLLLALAFAVPLLLIAAISAVKPVFHPRYAIPVASGLYLLLAAGLERGFFRSRSPTAPLAAGVTSVALLIGFGYGLWHLQYDGAYARDDYRSAVGFVRQNERPGDAIADNAVPPLWYYNHGPAPAAYLPTGAYTGDGVAKNLDDVTRGHGRLWYLDNITIPSDPDGYVEAQLRVHAQRLEERWYGPIHLELWQVPGDLAFAAATFQPAALDLGGQLALTGYALAPEGSPEIHGGESLDVELRWVTRATPGSDDGFWAAIEDDAGRTWGRADARPRNAAFQLTSGWRAGETNVVRLDLPVAVGTPPGSYRLVVGGYRLSDLRGLDVLDSTGHALGQDAAVATVSVTGWSTGPGDPSLPVQTSLDVAPSLRLVGHDAAPRALAPGDHLPVSLLWKAIAPAAPPTAGLELRAANGAVLARVDGFVGGTGTEPWPAGVLAREQRALVVPPNAPAGKTALVLVKPDGGAVTLQTYDLAAVARTFQAPAPAHLIDASLGGTFTLAGDDLSATSVKPGGNVVVTLTWKSNQATSTSYHVFVHLLDAGNHVVSQWDGIPRNWTYPTSAWLPGEYVVDRYPLALPPAAPPGPLSVEVGLYDASTGARLPVSLPNHPDDTRVLLGTIEVTG